MKIVFMGTPAAAVPSLERIIHDGHDVVAVYTQPDRPAGRGNRLTAPPVKEAAIASGITVLQPTRIRTAEALETFRAHGADVAVVVAYGRILPESFLKAFPSGAVNVHFSLLPKYRGAAPVNWAIVNGETVTGVTTMRIDAGLDTGDILLQREVTIGRDENSAELMRRLSTIGADLLSETLRRMPGIVPVPQDDETASFAPLMKKEDGRIDWNLPAITVANRVRGFQPFPTSFSFYEGKKVTIWRAAPSGEVQSSAKPGEILNAKGGDLVVNCGEGSLYVEELQIEGKKRMSTRDFLNGVKFEIGGRFE